VGQAAPTGLQLTGWRATVTRVHPSVKGGSVDTGSSAAAAHRHGSKLLLAPDTQLPLPPPPTWCLPQVVSQPATYMAVLLLQPDGSARLEFIQNMEYKYVALLSISCAAVPEVLVRSYASARHEALQGELGLVRAQLEQLSALVSGQDGRAGGRPQGVGASSLQGQGGREVGAVGAHPVFVCDTNRGQRGGGQEGSVCGVTVCNRGMGSSMCITEVAECPESLRTEQALRTWWTWSNGCGLQLDGEATVPHRMLQAGKSAGRCPV
jgi:hypothetical protein